jgi:hypothetical protein
MLTVLFSVFLALLLFALLALSRLVRRVDALKDSIDDQCIGIRRIERELWPPERKYQRKKANSSVGTPAAGVLPGDHGSTRGRDY